VKEEVEEILFKTQSAENTRVILKVHVLAL
jgi:hypothetical protein